MDENKIALIRLLIGDIPTSPFYQLFTDEQLQQFLDLAGGDVLKAARYAAVSASMLLAGWSTRERTGDIEVWNSMSSSYLAALNLFLGNSAVEIPSGLMPWAAGLSRAEMCEFARNPDLIQSDLLNIYVCDGENPCGPETFYPSGCGC